MKKIEDIVTSETLLELQKNGFSVVPFDVPDYAVGELMLWTGCECPNKSWEAINCAINMINNSEYDPDKKDLLSKLGAGEITLSQARMLIKTLTYKF